MVQQWASSTNEATATILGAKFWRVGKTIVGSFVRTRTAEIGVVSEFTCVSPASLSLLLDERGKLVEAGGQVKSVDRFGIGSLTGFEMAVQGLQFRGFDGFKFGDKVKIKCTGERLPRPNESPMLEFSVEVKRDATAGNAHPTAVQQAVRDVVAQSQPRATQAEIDAFEQGGPPPAKTPITDDDIPF